ncbi:hypothetical protein Ae717Ps2_6726 [Pseudonocardia sp. Ae717_Ps2]|nr:hypothetical protein Ae717Ps2_6656 [Pseudonocardia sp. Ae717_Ps2]OLM28182.1 hypothetical protein Ae717Ps2_6669 [Pseudonocardia sp. Ae717_Ps2]OLM28190.1 hypothetical protein Ae717Ps2_6677 [Pseudonocardia sp. Ae717_Ps2]OLM28197.1 hypothetical protein Ae717Ps2_6684 [Pseudonocardia sp. Ae717_Ps2]OLM28204.1 hypothetical protein Ae717Ps2_6691 [Pseudonocardia sp. Ae717_Ps2]
MTPEPLRALQRPCRRKRADVTAAPPSKASPVEELAPQQPVRVAESAERLVNESLTSRSLLTDRRSPTPFATRPPEPQDLCIH